mmetsp:Transcript_16690/g.20398  ORF Transcript_16690/g.20398 Transcript_16690/m.20398 type:complete len:133 (+) Transcript_16690:3766-4164(+)
MLRMVEVFNSFNRTEEGGPNTLAAGWGSANGEEGEAALIQMQTQSFSPTGILHQTQQRAAIGGSTHIAHAPGIVGHDAIRTTLLSSEIGIVAEDGVVAGGGQDEQVRGAGRVVGGVEGDEGGDAATDWHVHG